MRLEKIHQQSQQFRPRIRQKQKPLNPNQWFIDTNIGSLHEISGHSSDDVVDRRKDVLCVFDLEASAHRLENVVDDATAIMTLSVGNRSSASKTLNVVRCFV